MGKLDHNATAVADAYAKTLLDLCLRKDNADRVVEEFGDFVELMKKDAAFGDFMSSVAVDEDARRAVLEKHFRGKMDDLLLSTLQVINRRGRCDLLGLIRERFVHWLGEHRNQVEVQVASAIPLTDALREKLRAAIQSLTGHAPRIRESVDPSLLGGLVIRVGDDKLDGSVRRQLRIIYDHMHERASVELHSNRQYYETAGA